MSIDCSIKSDNINRFPVTFDIPIALHRIVKKYSVYVEASATNFGIIDVDQGKIK